MFFPQGVQQAFTLSLGWISPALQRGLIRRPPTISKQFYTTKFLKVQTAISGWLISAGRGMFDGYPQFRISGFVCSQLPRSVLRKVGNMPCKIKLEIRKKMGVRFVYLEQGYIFWPFLSIFVQNEKQGNIWRRTWKKEGKRWGKKKKKKREIKHMLKYLYES